MKHLVTVIIPAYNAETTLLKTLESLREQTYSNFQAVIVNDGSTDQTAKLVEDIMNRDKRFKLINQQNGGVSSARNAGLKYSEDNGTDYVCFLDSDDYYKNTYIELMLNQAIFHSSNLVYCGYLELNERSINKNQTEFTSKRILQKFINGRIKVHTSGWLISKDLINGKRFQEGLAWGEDHLFFYNILINSPKISYVEDYLTVYNNLHSESRLSAHYLDKLHLDKNFIEKSLDAVSILNDSTINSLLLNYRLPALLVYRILNDIKINGISEEHFSMYQIYKEDIDMFKFNNGLRSLKLILSILNLKFKIRIYRRSNQNG